VLSLIAGILILINGVFIAAIGAIIATVFPGIGLLLAVIGLVFGIIVLVGAIMMWSNPSQHVTWGVIVLLFSIFSIVNWRRIHPRIDPWPRRWDPGYRLEAPGDDGTGVDAPEAASVRTPDATAIPAAVAASRTAAIALEPPDSVHGRSARCLYGAEALLPRPVPR
jgi:hypothetical protein